ncbi:unnamed protein product [Euphydryas editha]|uniref:unspecific monooxygenase n=1 Tax=Euphydryas editha TaxID=104508 RepID=A0AAU9TKU8_EUPED|nr:unnamed protein product [Euphydryas editha]
MYWYLTLVSTILCSVTSFYLWWSKIKRYWADRDVPHLPPVPFLGSFTFLQRENILYALKLEHYQTDIGCVGFINSLIAWRPGLLVNSPKISRNILIKDFDIFKNRFLSSGDTDPVGSLNLLTVNDPLWSSVRRQLGGLFTSAKLRIFQDHTRAKAKELVQRIHNDRNNKIDIKKMFVDYTTDVIGTTAFGIKSDATLTGAGPLRDITHEFSRYSVFRNISWYSIFFFPELVDIFRFKFFPKSSLEYFKKVFQLIMSRREIYEKDKKTIDLLDFLINIKKENANFSEDLIIAQAAILLFGGYETSGNLLTYITYELAHNPKIQDKLYQELSEAVRRNGNDDFDMTTLSELTYLTSVVKETLRIYTPMGWIDRIASEDYKVDDKLTIEAGTVVYINCFGMHLDPKYFPDPYKFDPDRFLPENSHNIEPHTYLPFGEGPRACIGKRFGLMTVQLGLAQVLLNYKILPYSNSPKPSEIKISSSTVWLIPGETLSVQFIPR